MRKVIVATVSQDGRFLKAITTEGIDVSNQVDRGIRRAALEQGVQVQQDAVTGMWMLATSSPAALETVEPIELVSNDAGHEEVKGFIHNSIGLKPEQLIMSDLKWKYLVRSAMRGKNIMMVGPAGAGKTMASKYLVSALNRPDFYFNLGATQDPRATLIGNTHFSKEEGTYFSESLFVKAIQTENAVILLDELSRAHPEAWNILMTVLDLNQRYLRLDEKEGAPTVKVAPGVSFIATANVGNEYTSTRVMDRALMDRFEIIEVDILSLSQEEDLLTKRFGDKVSGNLIHSVADIADATRKEWRSEEGKLTTMISTRMTVRVCELLSDGFSLSEAAEVAILPFFDASGGTDSERTFVKQIVQKHMATEFKDIFNTGDDDTKQAIPF
jgi:MoxR-like ATPase